MLAGRVTPRREVSWSRPAARFKESGYAAPSRKGTEVHNEPNESAENSILVVDLGDAADLTLGSGQSTQEAKRQVYN
jgi:hypothetical protein